MEQKDYLITATNNKIYNIRMCEIIATGSETTAYDKLFIIYKTPEGEYIKRVKSFHPSAGLPDISYEIISNKELNQYQGKNFI